MRFGSWGCVRFASYARPLTRCIFLKQFRQVKVINIQRLNNSRSNYEFMQNIFYYYSEYYKLSSQECFFWYFTCKSGWRLVKSIRKYFCNLHTNLKKWMESCTEYFTMSGSMVLEYCEIKFYILYQEISNKFVAVCGNLKPLLY